MENAQHDPHKPWSTTGDRRVVLYTRKVGESRSTILTFKGEIKGVSGTLTGRIIDIELKNLGLGKTE